MGLTLNVEKIQDILDARSMTLEDLNEIIKENDEKLFNSLENEDFDPMEFLSILKIATALKVDVSEIIAPQF